MIKYHLCDDVSSVRRRWIRIKFYIWNKKKISVGWKSINVTKVHLSDSNLSFCWKITNLIKIIDVMKFQLCKIQRSKWSLRCVVICTVWWKSIIVMTFFHRDQKFINLMETQSCNERWLGLSLGLFFIVSKIKEMF